MAISLLNTRESVRNAAEVPLRITAVLRPSVTLSNFEGRPSDPRIRQRYGAPLLAKLAAIARTPLTLGT